MIREVSGDRKIKTRSFLTIFVFALNDETRSRSHKHNFNISLSLETVLGDSAICGDDCCDSSTKHYEIEMHIRMSLLRSQITRFIRLAAVFYLKPVFLCTKRQLKINKDSQNALHIHASRSAFLLSKQFHHYLLTKLTSINIMV